ncbi:NodT family efflux transporter outer membrane factor (OMF) lipoprotein [Bordetella tumbae]|uniref:efflux transporter outer membrane subunit n=1 Tax=Bordetella tumbae TaxID=1649139 RepID=UPI0039EF909E
MKSSFFRFSVVMAGVALLSACASTDAPPTRELQVPANYNQGITTANGSQHPITLHATHPAVDIAKQAWWKGFGDARLDRLITDVLAVNADLASAGLTLRKARLQAGLASNDLWPQPSGSVNTNGSRYLDTHDSVQRSSNANLSLSWEIDLWGRLRAARDVADWEARATAEDKENTALSLVAEVCEQYWTLAYLNQSIASGQAHLDQLQQILQLVQVQFGAGAVSQLELREAQQNVQAQQIAQSQLLQERVETRNAIAVLRDGAPWPLSDEPGNLDDAQSPPLQAGVPAELLGRRPDLRAAELRLREALSNIKATARSYYPALTLTGSVGTSSSALSDVLQNPLGTLGAGLTLPFLNLPQMQLNTDIAKTEYEISASNFRTTLYTALKEVGNALSARDQLVTQVDAAQASFDAARDVERMYGVRYRSGAADLRTWLDAQQTLRDAELSLAQRRRDQLLNDVTLYLALGGSATQ